MMQNVFIVGGQRCGTTYLADVLSMHKDVEVIKPLLPEPKILLLQDFDKESYPRSNSKYIVEKSTCYLYKETPRKLLLEHFPDSKIIIVIRSPVERAISHYRLSCYHGVEHREIQEAISNPLDYDKSKFSMSPYAYLRYGDYLEYIRNYPDALVTLFEDLTQNRFEEVEDFLKIKLNTTSSTYRHEIKYDADISSQTKEMILNHFTPKIKNLQDYLGINLESKWMT